MVPSKTPTVGYRYLTPTQNGIIVKMPDKTSGLVTARENAVPLLLFNIIKVEVKTAGNAAAIPPRTGPPISLKSTEVVTSAPAPTPRKMISQSL